jgi:NAD-reducing hydrogenase small subunit
MSFLDLDEFLIDLAQLVDVVFSPVVDPKQYPANVDICLIEGAVCNDEHLHIVQTIRKNTKIVVSFGDCAVTSNVTGMRNPFGNAEVVLKPVYLERPDANRMIPSDPGVLPVLLDKALPVNNFIPVDYYLPGCPPPAGRIKALLTQLLSGKVTGLAGADIKFG